MEGRGRPARLPGRGGQRAAVRAGGGADYAASDDGRGGDRVRPYSPAGLSVVP